MRAGKAVLALLGGALVSLALGSSPAAAAVGIDSFSGTVLDAQGNVQSQAGAHPFEVVNSLHFTDSDGDSYPDEQPRSIRVRLPQGFAGNPTAVPQCSAAAAVYAENNGCPDTTQVGYTTINFGTGEGPAPVTVPIYNMVPPDGVPAVLAFNLILPNVVLQARLRPNDFGLDIELKGISTSLPLLSADTVLWGVPADPRHDTDRGICLVLEDPDPTACPSGLPQEPFLANPTSCAVGPPETSVAVDSWENPGRRDGEGAPDLSDPNWTTASFQLPTATLGCANLEFGPKLEVEPASRAADTPSGYEVVVSLPQNETPNGLATAHLKQIKLALPDGVTVNPASADGLQACSLAQISLGNDAPATCPGASKIGTVEIETPVLEEHLTGSLYLARQYENPFGSLLALYLVAENPLRGVRIKLAGEIEADPVTGQLTTSFDDNPQLPFSRLSVRLKGGSHAALVNPATCGTKTAVAEMTPYAALGQFPTNIFDSSLVKHPADSFQVGSGPGGSACPAAGQFDPGFEAGTIAPIAGAYSPLVVKASRPDGSQSLRRLDVDLPQGLIGKLAGIAYCSEASLTAAAGKSGQAELASPSCPSASRIGWADVGAGPGAAPFHVGGTAYLTGPYKGAPLGLAVITPAVAGPFDLGTVVVRAAVRIDPTTAQVHAESDPIPTILQGIPLHIRSLTVGADRPDFIANPTSCDPTSLDGTLFGASLSKTLSDRFQVGACAALRFAPKLALNLKGGTKRGSYPALKATLNAKPGQANIERVSVALPHSAFLAQEHIRTVCTRVQFAADACPAGSVYGHATATTPLLDQPLSGPVYLRSSNNPLPDLVAALDGQIEIDLVGRIDSVDGGIRTRFESVPDAPVSRFVLQMKGGKKGLLVNSRNLCNSTNKAKVLIDGQNGKSADQRPVLTNSCGKKAKKKKQARARR